ncbi:glycosyltransferase [Desulfocurvus vexinensis]|uniref:glycosyltransferase n=1 Tax=Desulfocurvus vexinensis TaxID=399548 RepID=UPI0004900BB5|nr:glycosyltransferase [Desulfocurvus vexinensis]
MRIGLYGGEANATYLIAQALARAGQDVLLVRDWGMYHPFGHPVWQDAPLRLDAGELADGRPWGRDRVRALEARAGWRAPAWVADPLEAAPAAAPAGGRLAGVRGLDAAFLKAVFLRRPHLAASLDLLRGCDLVVCNGLEGTVLGMLSGRPVLLWPFGTDIRLVAGFDPPGGGSLRAAVENRCWRRLMRRAYPRALGVGSHDPRVAGGERGDAFAASGARRLLYFPLPMPEVDPPLGRAARRAALAGALAALGQPCPEAEVVCVVPSRLDARVKGSDRLLRAVARLAGAGRLHVLALGWGRDRQALAAACGPEHVTVLPFVLSKPLLYGLMSGADLVADQFVVGGYGAAALEAMACGAPVLMHLDAGAFAAKGFALPPVLQARTEEDIAAVLAAVLDGGIDLDARGREALEWTRRVHGWRAVAEEALPQVAALARAQTEARSLG